MPEKTELSGSPTVTVITIFLNAEGFLEEALASVVAQTCEEWEYLLVDDGSSDRSTGIAREWARRHPGKIRYLEHSGHENRGMSASRNLGIRNARAEFIAFLDADDVWRPHKLEEQLAVMAAQPRAAMVYGRTEIWHSWTGAAEDAGRDHTLELGVPAETLAEPPAILLLLVENRVQTPTTCSAMLRRAVVEEVGGFEESFRGMFEDQAFFAKVSLRYPIFVSGRCWARYRQHPDSCCATAGAAGSLVAARLPLLRWMQSYVSGQEITDPTIERALGKEIWLCEHPLARRVLKHLKRAIRRRG